MSARKSIFLGSAILTGVIDLGLAGVRPARAEDTPTAIIQPGIYAPALSIKSGTRFTEAGIKFLLEAFGYKRAKDKPQTTGEYSIDGDTLSILTRELVDEEGVYYPKMSLTYSLSAGTITNKLGTAPDGLHFPPILLASFGKGSPAAAKTAESMAPFLKTLAERGKDVLPADAGDLSKLAIFTRLNTTYQDCARSAFPDDLPGALIAVSVSSGDILAWSEHGTGTEPLGTAERQLGSLAKAFVLFAAVDKSISPTPLSQLTPIPRSPESAPTASEGDAETGRAMLNEQPKPSANRPLSLREVAETLSGPESAALGDMLGMAAKVDPLLEKLHVKRPTVLDVTNAFVTIAAGGKSTPPKFFSSVMTTDGKILELREPAAEQISDPVSMYLLTDMLRGTVNHGTATKLRELGYQPQVAALPGKNIENTDFWFAGYSPRIAVVAWNGGSKDSPTRGEENARQTWFRFMSCVDAQTKQPEAKFPVPQGIRFDAIDRQSFETATRSCPKILVEDIAARVEDPLPASCSIHGPRGYNPGIRPGTVIQPTYPGQQNEVGPRGYDGANPGGRSGDEQQYGQQRWPGTQPDNGSRQTQPPQRQQPSRRPASRPNTVSDLWNTFRRGTDSIWRRR